MELLKHELDSAQTYEHNLFGEVCRLKTLLQSSMAAMFVCLLMRIVTNVLPKFHKMSLNHVLLLILARVLLLRCP